MAFVAIGSLVVILLYALGFIVLILLVIVLLKLNKVLDIWLEQNRRY